MLQKIFIVVLFVFSILALITIFPLNKESLPFLSLLSQIAESLKIQERPIDLKSVVVLRCLFVNPQTKTQKTVTGSGVIISPEGLIATARHVVDQDYASGTFKTKKVASGYLLSHCDAGYIVSDQKSPTAKEIKKINPFFIIEVLPFTAKPYFLPDTANWSKSEGSLFDAAILKIAGLNETAKLFDVKMPKSFNHTPILTKQLPKNGDEVITFGFPTGSPEYGGRFFLQGSVGKVKRIIKGEETFYNQPLEIESEMEIIAGRSGSALFWKGYVVGIISFKKDYSLSAFATSVVPLAKIIKIISFYNRELKDYVSSFKAAASPLR